ncbi:MAG: site-2 protease family protein [Nitrospirae bacterium]|nr:site-2 protease family protein [Nitrospirota bacterium]
MDWLRQVGAEILIIGLPLLFAVTLHEIAHGLVADRLGDPTARFMGRLTLNPLAHIDPFGTILLPLALILLHTGFLFGYAKPVPIVEKNLPNPRRDMMLVAAAGPISNLLQAFLYMSMLHILLSQGIPVSGGGGFPSLLDQIFRMGIELNVVLLVFNLIPLPPLDGGRVLSGLLPAAAARSLSRIEPYGVLIIMGLIILDPYLGFMSRFVWPVMGALSSWILSLATS